MPAPLIIGDVVVPANAIEVTASRGSGPGGQNVNKVASKVTLLIALDAAVGLDDPTRARLMARLARRLDAAGRLLVTSQKTRDQAQNLKDAYAKARAWIAAALATPKPRRPTRPGPAAVRRRLEDKRHTSERKQARRHEDS